MSELVWLLALHYVVAFICLLMTTLTLTLTLTNPHNVKFYNLCRLGYTSMVVTRREGRLGLGLVSSMFSNYETVIG